MERLKLTHSNMIVSQPDWQFFLASSIDEINIPDNSMVNLLLMDVVDHQNIKINVGSGSTLLISSLIKDNVDGTTLEINIKDNSNVEAYLSDFTTGKEEFKLTANLLERGSSLNWHLASLTGKDDNKRFDISVHHIAMSTFARMDNYGVCKDNGKLTFAGISSINNGAKSSKTHQNAKIMVFDKESIGIAKPILKIDENDVEASHAAVVGKINDEHLFYLTSRGLTEVAAKELITLGYLKPIMSGFIEDSIKEEILSLIERRM